MAVDGHAFRHPDGLYRVRGSDILGSKVRLMIERPGVPPFECTLVRDALPAVQIKAKIFSTLDRLILLVSEELENTRQESSAGSHAIVKSFGTGGRRASALDDDKENAGNNGRRSPNFKYRINSRKWAVQGHHDEKQLDPESDSLNSGDVSTVSEAAEELAAVRFMVGTNA